MMENNQTVLSPAVRAHIDNWVLRYPPGHQRSGVFEALRVVQEENGGFLTTELMDAVADYLNMPRIAVYEVATFYSLYHLHPVGKTMIDVCTNISCMLNGSEKILMHLQKHLGIDVNQTSADGKWSLREVECLGACINAPVCQIGKKYYEALTPEKMDAILEDIKTNAEIDHGK